jgi:hypothetical protein
MIFVHKSRIKNFHMYIEYINLSQKVSGPKRFLQNRHLDVVHQFPEAVDQDPFGQDHGLEHELRSRLEESLKASQVDRFLLPATLSALAVRKQDSETRIQ